MLLFRLLIKNLDNIIFMLQLKKKELKMAKDSSFDIVSEFDKQELVNAVDQVKRDITSRFDLKNSKSDVVLDGEKSITVTTEDDMK